MKVRQRILFVIMLLLGIFMLYPLLFALFASLSDLGEYYQARFLPVPKEFWKHFDNYVLVFRNSRLTRSLGITLMRTVYSFFITTFTSYIGGYVFAKLKFPFKRFCFLFLITSMMIPGVALFVPNYIWLARFPLVGGNDITGNGGTGYIDNPLMLIFLSGWIQPYNIYLFRQTLYSLGNEMKEAAEVDGASLFTVMFRVYFPLCSPIVAVILLAAIVGNWSEYVGNTIYLRGRSEWWTVGNIIYGLIDEFSSIARTGGPDYPKAFATAMVSIVPPVLTYILLQRYVTEGLTAGAVKG
ncbi:MAG: carbohydrate ABC transporter permease [Clostridia bacterium]|nr:carbohydrate ABC transporter permease [Clostridia bacterium]MBQ9480607.1 carbohydrate ABC transporter permease [Clostridia bacterium]